MDIPVMFASPDDFEIVFLVEFTKEAVKAYLDGAIRHWRGLRDRQPEALREECMAAYYVDAFQSVRVSLFGERLGVEDDA
jgi:hypothetical protein